MHRCFILIICALAVSACTTPHQLARCHGPLLALNSDHWQPTALELDALGKLCPEEK